MAVGSVFHVTRTNAISSKLLQVFGSTDIHTHFRTRPLIEWAKNKKDVHFGTIMEIGCGDGGNIFELAQIMAKDVKFIGVDLSEESIKVAAGLAISQKLSNVSFFCRDCSRLQLEHNPDVVLLIDFLEHISDPSAFLRDVRAMVKDDTILLISVPTPLYPKVFGRRFHEKVGHVVEGYDEQSLSKLLEQTGFEISSYEYNTGLVASSLCYVYYNRCFNVTGKARTLMGLFLSFFRWADFYALPKMSCSLFATVVVSDAGRVHHAQ